MKKKAWIILLCVLVVLCVVCRTIHNANKPTGQPQQPQNLTDPVFKTENIKNIKFYAYYGNGVGSKVPAEHMTEIINWLGSFAISDEAEEILPGTNTYYVEIKYADGMVVRHGLDTASIDGTTYYLERDAEPECFREIISKTRLNWFSQWFNIN